jgi:pseudouridine-5'-phosphate glycosidase
LIEADRSISTYSALDDFLMSVQIQPDIASAIMAGQPVVALESSLICHGLPWPDNLETARSAEEAVRATGAVPATVAIWNGSPIIGLACSELEALAQNANACKASRRDLGHVVACRQTAGTTVSATMYLAWRAGIRFMATGGIGGVHRSSADRGDVSADLWELSRTPVAVFCSGAKNLVDVARTLELLETWSVPVSSYRAPEFPAFYSISSGCPSPRSLDDAKAIAGWLDAHWRLDGAGAVMAQAIADQEALDRNEIDDLVSIGLEQAAAHNIEGPQLTPYLLKFLAEKTGGRTLRANYSLVLANAHLAAMTASEWMKLHG